MSNTTVYFTAAVTKGLANCVACVIISLVFFMSYVTLKTTKMFSLTLIDFFFFVNYNLCSIVFKRHLVFSFLVGRIDFGR